MTEEERRNEIREVMRMLNEMRERAQEQFAETERLKRQLADLEGPCESDGIKRIEGGES